MWAIPNSSIFLESCFTLTYLWQSSAICCKVIFGLFSNLFIIRRLISVSFVETSSCTNIQHLKLSALSYASLKSSQSLFTTDAKVVKSSPSFLVRLRHFHLLWKREVFGRKSSISNSTASVNGNSQGIRAECNLWILCAQLCQVYTEDDFFPSHSNFHCLFCINLHIS